MTPSSGVRADGRPAVWDGGDGNRQDSFKALDHDWLVTYTTYNRGPRHWHSICICCAPAAADDAKAALIAAAAAIGCHARLT